MDAAQITLITGVLITICISICLIFSYCRNPFDLPELIIHIDISGKRQPVYEEYVDMWINDLSNHKQDINKQFKQALYQWDCDCKTYIHKSMLWKKHREDQYEYFRYQVIQPNYQMFVFIFSRNQTRYSQKNYQKMAYTVQNTSMILKFTLIELYGISDQLEDIQYETTRYKWNDKNQRKLMTKALKLRIKKRDKYTCQMCGKHMPDEVGLHIDHIIPIKRGGKSIEDNLQVLCDKCNLRKSSK